MDRAGDPTYLPAICHGGTKSRRPHHEEETGNEKNKVKKLWRAGKPVKKVCMIRILTPRSDDPAGFDALI